MIFLKSSFDTGNAESAIAPISGRVQCLSSSFIWNPRLFSASFHELGQLCFPQMMVLSTPKAIVPVTKTEWSQPVQYNISYWFFYFILKDKIVTIIHSILHVCSWRLLHTIIFAVDKAKSIFQEGLFWLNKLAPMMLLLVCGPLELCFWDVVKTFLQCTFSCIKDPW